MSGDRSTRPTRRAARRLVGLALGIAAVVAGTIVGATPSLADSILRGPAVLRAALTGLSFVVGLWLLGVSLSRLAGDAAAEAPGGSLRDRPPRSFVDMIRGIRYAFLAVAAFAAASAFLLGSLLPLVIALVIAGVDVAETGLLLLVAQTHHEDGDGS